MKTDEFIRLCVRKGINITNTTTKGWSIYGWQELAELTANVDFGCDFKEGKCRNNGQGYLHRDGGGCCGGCASTIGYLDDIPCCWQTLIKMARLYNKRQGFWRKGKGCVLPHRVRSSTCLGYVCHRPDQYEDIEVRQRRLLSPPAYKLIELLANKPPKKNLGDKIKEIKLALEGE